jgi:hypothetical protein
MDGFEGESIDRHFIAMIGELWIGRDFGRKWSRRDDVLCRYLAGGTERVPRNTSVRITGVRTDYLANASQER